MDRFQTLVFSFYREEPDIKAKLQPLNQCRISLSWGVIRIECKDYQHMRQIAALIVYLRHPFAELRLRRRIALRSPGSLQQFFELNLSLRKDLTS